MAEVDKGWSLEQAEAAQGAFQASGGSFADPTGPLFRWVALHRLDTLGKQYHDGNNFALMVALRVCANHDLVMPPWVSRAYIARFDRISHYYAKSWDDVLGLPVPKGKHLNQFLKRQKLAPAVYLRVCNIINAPPGSAIVPADLCIPQGRVPVDDLLFDAVGKEFGIGTTLCKQYYYTFRKHLESDPAVSGLMAPYALSEEHPDE